MRCLRGSDPAGETLSPGEKSITKAVAREDNLRVSVRLAYETVWRGGKNLVEKKLTTLSKEASGRNILKLRFFGHPRRMSSE
jgi:hypothetical protein